MCSFQSLFTFSFTAVTPSLWQLVFSGAICLDYLHFTFVYTLASLLHFCVCVAISAAYNNAVFSSTTTPPLGNFACLVPSVSPPVCFMQTIKKKASRVFKGKKDEDEQSPAPPVPAIPPRYHVPTPPPFSRPRPDTGRAFPSQPTASNENKPTKKMHFASPVHERSASQDIMLSGPPKSPFVMSEAARSASEVKLHSPYAAMSSPQATGTPPIPGAFPHKPVTSAKQKVLTPPYKSPYTPKEAPVSAPQAKFASHKYEYPATINEAAPSQMTLPLRDDDHFSKSEEPSSQPSSLPTSKWKKKASHLYIDTQPKALRGGAIPSSHESAESSHTNPPEQPKRTRRPSPTPSDASEQVERWLTRGTPLDTSFLDHPPSARTIPTIRPYTFRDTSSPASPPFLASSPYTTSAFSESARTIKTSPDRTPLSPTDDAVAHDTRASTSSSRSKFSARTSSGAASTEKPKALKARKSLRDLFKRSASPDVAYVSRPVLVPQPPPATSVPPLPATVRFTPPPGPPPRRPERGETDEELLALSQRGLTRVGFVVEREERRMVVVVVVEGEGKKKEQYCSGDQYVVERSGEVRVPRRAGGHAPTLRRGMVIKDRTTGTLEFVADI
ncbi:hypothetical protein BU23DRAFT_164164 [Bimuria novae-zelandiae CBS 107.79]|uniref:Uncharacterized protein n=1 Tax=Bimuria novae-zelandiae CBS 107.79 TaxID=1447943 RepID=A0A6A5V527_9PLEO|nr:hypothetical protein BU23DRAFT_164164 [Bimuria novae-zelandiae CBS 107.79]